MGKGSALQPQGFQSTYPPSVPLAPVSTCSGLQLPRCPLKHCQKCVSSTCLLFLYGACLLPVFDACSTADLKVGYAGDALQVRIGKKL